MDKLRVKNVNKHPDMNRRCPSWQTPFTQSPQNIYYTKQSGGNSGDSRNVYQQYSVIRPNPNAPHLKYGLFSNKRVPSGFRNNSQTNYMCRQPHTDGQKRDNHKKIEKKSVTKTVRSGMMTKSTAFTYPSSQRQLEHHLSLSRVKHIDIKPRYSCNPPPMFNPPMPFQLISDINVA